MITEEQVYRGITNSLPAFQKSYFEKICKNKNITLTNLAKELGINYRTLLNIKNGHHQISREITKKLAKFLNEDPSKIYYDFISQTKYLCFNNGISEAALYRLCQLFIEGNVILVNSRIVSSLDKVNNLAGIAYIPRGSRKVTIVEDWNKLCEDYSKSVLHFNNIKDVKDLFRNEYSYYRNIFLYGYNNLIFRNFNLISDDMYPIGIDKYIEVTQMTESQKCLSNNYTQYELIFDDELEFNKFNHFFKNVIKEKNIHAFYIPIKDNMKFDHICSQDFFDLTLLIEAFQIGRVTFDPIITKYNLDQDDIDKMIEEQNNIIAKYNDGIDRVLNLAIGMANSFEYVETFRNDIIEYTSGITIMSTEMDLNEEWKSIYESNSSDFFLMEKLMLIRCLLVDFNKNQVDSILNEIKDLLDYFNSSPLKRFIYDILYNGWGPFLTEIYFDDLQEE